MTSFKITYNKKRILQAVFAILLTVEPLSQVFLFALGKDELVKLLNIIYQSIIGLLFVVLIFRFKNNFKLDLKSLVFLCLIYTILFSLFRTVTFDKLDGYYLSLSQIIIYLIINLILVFVSLGFKFHSNFRLDMIGVQRVIIYGGTIFALICIYLYGENLGQVSRLTYKTNISDYSVINPIRLAYFSSIFIGVSMINFIKLGNVDRIIALFTVVFNTVILILSASRGPFISLIFSLALLFFINNKTKYLIFAVPLVMLLLSILSDYSTRLTNLSIQTVVDDQERIPRYFDSLNSFENSPIIGSYMKMNSYDGYPHNIFIEFLQMTGLLGTTLFLIILSISFLNMKSFCFRHNSFIPFIFLFSLINLQVSGSFLTAQLFWISTSILYFINAYSTDI